MKFFVITSASMQICVRLEALIGSSSAPGHRIWESCLWISFLSSRGKKKKKREKKVLFIWLQGWIQFQLLNIP